MPLNSLAIRKSEMKRELRYGENVGLFLGALSQIEPTELAADAAQIISAQRDQLQAAEHLAELRGRQNLDTQRKLEALAAENVALKESVDHAAGCIHAAEVEGLEDALESNDGERLADLIHRRLCHAHLPVVTPATDAYLNSVRADALNDLCIAFVKHANRAGLDDDENISLRECTDALQHCCNQIRAGEPS